MAYSAVLCTSLAAMDAGLLASNTTAMVALCTNVSQSQPAPLAGLLVSYLYRPLAQGARMYL